jgi:hypothetical protein
VDTSRVVGAISSEGTDIVKSCACGHAEESHESVTPGLKPGSDVTIHWGALKFEAQVVGGCIACDDCKAFTPRPVPPWIQILRMAEHARRTGTRVAVAAPGDERNVWGASVAMPLGYRIDQDLDDEEEFALCEMLATRVMDHATTLIGRPKARTMRDGDQPCAACGALVNEPCIPTHDGERDADGTWSHPMRAKGNLVPQSVRRLVEWAHATEHRRDVIDLGGLPNQDVATAVRRLCDAIPAYSTPRQCDAVSASNERCERRHGHADVHRMKLGDGGLVEWQ